MTAQLFRAWQQPSSKLHVHVHVCTSCYTIIQARVFVLHLKLPFCPSSNEYSDLAHTVANHDITCSEFLVIPIKTCSKELKLSRAPAAHSQIAMYVHEWHGTQ